MTFPTPVAARAVATPGRRPARARLAALAAAAQVALPAVAAACPACLSSAYGDRTFNWAFLGLLVMPFVVGVAIGGALLYRYGLPGALRARLGGAAAPAPGAAAGPGSAALALPSEERP